MTRENLLSKALGLVVLLLLTQTAFSNHVIVNLSATAQQADEGDSYKAFYEANAAKDLPKAYELAKKHLQDFPNGKYAEYFKTKYIPNTRAKLFNEAYAAKNTEALLRLGNEALTEDPNDLNFLITLAHHLNVNEVNAKPPITTHATEAEAFTRRATKLLEEGKKPAEGSAWKPNEMLNYFYQVLALIEQKNKKPENALAFYEKAQALDSANSFIYFQTGGIYQNRYAEATKRYDALPQAEKDSATPSAETQALLKEIHDTADATLERWIKFLKLTATNNTYGEKRAEIESVVTDLYKYRHPDSPEGFRELIKP